MRMKPHYIQSTRKPEAEAKGISYRPLADLLTEAEIICTCLPRNNYPATAK